MRFITATQIFSGKSFLKDDSVLVINNQNVISDIICKSECDQLKIENHVGILCPGFINAHCHLELSHLKNTIEQKTGIVDFGLGVIKNRNIICEELQLEYMIEADALMNQQGIVAVGDISNTALSIVAKQNSSLFYHTFVELIALNPDRAQLVFDAGKLVLNEFQNANLSASLAPHAPYSVSLPLIKLISDYCRELNLPTSIHNQESRAENDFFLFKAGDYNRLYQTLNITIDYFEPTNKSSLQTVIASLNKAVNTLLVHNTFTNKEDLDYVSKQHQQLFWCLCPNANLYIEDKLPDVSTLLDHNCMITFGTDSLASNMNLSIIDEIDTLLKYQPNLKLEALLKAATHNGALFLGIENEFGLLNKGKKPGINLIETSNEKFSVKKLIDIN